MTRVNNVDYGFFLQEQWNNPEEVGVGLAHLFKTCDVFRLGIAAVHAIVSAHSDPPIQAGAQHDIRERVQRITS